MCFVRVEMFLEERFIYWDLGAEVLINLRESHFLTASMQIQRVPLPIVIGM